MECDAAKHENEKLRCLPGCQRAVKRNEDERSRTRLRTARSEIKMNEAELGYELLETARKLVAETFFFFK